MQWRDPAEPVAVPSFGQGPMAAAASLAALQEAVHCPICLDDLRDPVTVECGHDFCRSCIRRSWADLRDRFPCPVCRHPCRERHPRSNGQLGRMVDVARLLQVARSQGQRREDRRVCEKHKRVVTLFCEEDLELLCALCARPPHHQGHQVRPAEEAASHHRRKLSGYLEALREQVADFLKLEAAQDRDLLRLREQLRHRRQRLASEYDHLMRCVEHAQEAALARLAEQERDAQRQLSADIVAFSRHVCTLQGLLAEVAESSVTSDARLLAALGGVLGRCGGPRRPAVHRVRVSREGCSLPPQHSALRQIVRAFAEDVTLDPATAHPRLRVSADRKSVTFVRGRRRLRRRPKGPLAAPAVLGAERFARGRHCWAVQVGDKPAWVVGVCAAAARGARGGLWTLRLRRGHYAARGRVRVALAPPEPPRRVGVYLDCELGQLSFYSVDDRSHLHSFRGPFPGALAPYFAPGRDPAPLTVCAATGDDG